MTTNQQIPFHNYTGNGSLKIFPFIFDLIEAADLFVVVDNVPQTQFSDYTIEPMFEDGGDIVFTEPPVSGAAVLIFRATTKSQQVDYESFTSFPADTHEWNLDKFCLILQELINGVIAGDDGEFITFDLSVGQAEFILNVLNSGGTDAALPMWTDEEFAGVYAASVDLEANLPADESVTTKPDGYVWLGI